jgi:hypothetical protein
MINLDQIKYKEVVAIFNRSYSDKDESVYRNFIIANADERLVDLMLRFLRNDIYRPTLKADEFVENCFNQFETEFTLTPNRFRKLKSVFHNVVRAPWLYIQRRNGASWH